MERLDCHLIKKWPKLPLVQSEAGYPFSLLPLLLLVYPCFTCYWLAKTCMRSVREQEPNWHFLFGSLSVLSLLRSLSFSLDPWKKSVSWVPLVCWPLLLLSSSSSWLLFRIKSTILMWNITTSFGTNSLLLLVRLHLVLVINFLVSFREL